MVSSGLRPTVLLISFVGLFFVCFAETEKTENSISEIVVQQVGVICPFVTQDLAQFEPIEPVTAIDDIPDVVHDKKIVTDVKNEDNGKFNGDTTLTNKIFRTLSVLGAANLFEVVVAHDAEIFGSCVSVDSNFNMLHVYGSADIKNAIIAGNCSITGIAKIKNVAISGDLLLNDDAVIGKMTVRKITTSGSRFNMSNSTASSLFIQKKDKGNGKQTIHISGGVVTGDVVFEGGNGCVILKKGAKIKGKVSGGVVVVQ